MLHFKQVVTSLFNLSKYAKFLTINILYFTPPTKLTDNHQVACFSIDKVFFIRYLLLCSFRGETLYKKINKELIKIKIIIKINTNEKVINFSYRNSAVFTVRVCPITCKTEVVRGF